MFNNKFNELGDFSEIGIESLSKHLPSSSSSSDDVVFIDESDYFSVLEDNVKISKWDGKAKILESEESKDLVSSLTEKGYDAILYIIERNTSDYIGHTNQYMLPKGFYSRPKIRAVYATFNVRLIDLETKKEIKHTSYSQGTAIEADEIEIDKTKGLANEEDKKVVVEKLLEAYEVAAKRVITMLKANKS
ncbi:hypothetical protein VDG1235_2391 [Verrucomicrobiia bacterium DG1235]|nr:hypothetical protein VDG1235_2391 [Verrucomicrobiae bacterium DG1235]